MNIIIKTYFLRIMEIAVLYYYKPSTGAIITEEEKYLAEYYEGNSNL